MLSCRLEVVGAGLDEAARGCGSLAVRRLEAALLVTLLTLELLASLELLGAPVAGGDGGLRAVRAMSSGSNREVLMLRPVG